MTNQKKGLSRTTLPQDYQALFDELPPLGSEEYIRLMEDMNGAEIPPQVLACAYRQLYQAKNERGSVLICVAVKIIVMATLFFIWFKGKFNRYCRQTPFGYTFRQNV